MKNKLLLSSALVGSLFVTGAVNAQTTVTGEINLSYKSIGEKGTPANGKSGLGRETQLNIQNKGKLSNGLDYAAGFSLEFDGINGADQAAGDTQRLGNENFYIDFISGNTTVSIGGDHVQNMSGTVIPRVAQNVKTSLVQAGSLAADTTYVARTAYCPGGCFGSSNSMGISVIQAMPSIGNLSLQYFPYAGNKQAGNDSIVNSASTDAYELMFQGDLGVKGLTARLGYAIAPKNASSNVSNIRDQVGQAYGLAYNLGNATVGVERKKHEAGTATTDYTMTSVGASYNISKELSVSAQYDKVSGSTAGVVFGENEKIRSYQVGYNLGAVTLSASYTDANNAAGVASNDSQIFLVRAGSKF
jgi:hypothetical protein